MNEVELTNIELLVIVGNLILALRLRYPENGAESSAIARKLANRFAKILIANEIPIPTEVIKEWRKEIDL
jgi:hypothetical protein